MIKVKQKVYLQTIIEALEAKEREIAFIKSDIKDQIRSIASQKKLAKRQREEKNV